MSIIMIILLSGAACNLGVTLDIGFILDLNVVLSFVGVSHRLSLLLSHSKNFRYRRKSRPRGRYRRRTGRFLACPWRTEHFPACQWVAVLPGNP